MKHMIITAFLALLLSLAGKAQQPAAVRVQHFNTENGVALQGYDPVAYFTQNEAVKGSEKYTYSYDGITYHFASADHLARFKENPRQYEPQYGGWCAYAMGLNGEKVEVDPETFKITGGKLYLFYNKFFTNTLTTWNKEEATLQPKADRYWQQIIR